MELELYNINIKEKFYSKINNFQDEKYEFLKYLTNKKEILNNFKQIKYHSNKLKQRTDVLIVVGIGGSILASKGFIEGKSKQDVIFMGQGFDFEAFKNKLNDISNKRIGLCYISKSGKTMETNLFFEFIKDKIKNENIVIISEKFSPAYQQAIDNDYTFFEIDKNVGGRFSFFTPVGQYPLAYSNINFIDIYKGFLDEINLFIQDKLKSIEYQYSIARVNLEKEKQVEVLASFDYQIQKLLPCLTQILAESLSKNEKGLYPTICNFSEDLHSLGQTIQEGKKCFLETFLSFNNNSKYTQTKIEETYQKYNEIALNSTLKAHIEAKNKIILITLEKNDYELGKLIAFYYLTVLLCAEFDDVNPTNQNGVENYKTKMINLLKNKIDN